MLIRRLYTACRRLSTARTFVVLGIETSCDDTAVGVVTSEGRVLANIVHSQLQVHLQSVIHFSIVVVVVVVVVSTPSPNT